MDAISDIGRIEDGIRRRSKALFGAQFRADVAAFIGVAGGPYWARSIGQALNIPENKVSAELSRFAEQNLLTAMDGADWDRRRLFERSPGSASYWAAALDFARAAAREVAIERDGDEAALLAAYLEHVHKDNLPDLAAFRHGP